MKELPAGRLFRKFGASMVSDSHPHITKCLEVRNCPRSHIDEEANAT